MGSEYTEKCIFKKIVLIKYSTNKLLEQINRKVQYINMENVSHHPVGLQQAKGKFTIGNWC